MSAPAAERIRHHARLIELGGMASALSHELRQPLFTISLAAENGMGLADEPRVRAKFERIIEQVERARTIIERVSHYARLEEASEAPVDLAEPIAAAAGFMRPLLAERHVRLTVETPERLYYVRASRIGIEQVLVNALQNALDAILSRRERAGDVSGGLVEVALTAGVVGAMVTVNDDGTGLDPSLTGSAFDAFLTTKPSGKGTGLGLYICRQIMRELGGRISLADRDAPARGARLTLWFPVEPVERRR